GRGGQRAWQMLPAQPAPHLVIPAKAGIQCGGTSLPDPRFSGMTMREEAQSRHRPDQGVQARQKKRPSKGAFAFAVAAAGATATVATYSSTSACITATTRRFWPRPASVSLSAIGRLSP